MVNCLYYFPGDQSNPKEVNCLNSGASKVQ